MKPQAVSGSPVRDEQGLARQLSTRQLTMIAIGGAIGTGLFLGSALAVRLAGPAVIITYALGACEALLLMFALSEMAVAHPTAGSFGVYAQIYLSDWAGFVVRYTYFACQAVAVGGEAVAVAIYCQWWLPFIPKWLWIIAFSAGIIYVNARSVASFGRFEYWFAMIKVVAIVLFIVFGGALLLRLVPSHVPAANNFTAHGGFAPHGISGIWLAMAFVIFSYIGTEIIAVTAGEAQDPEKALPQAMRSMVLRLVIFYIGAITVLVGVIPWNQIQPGSAITASPFVMVFASVGIPAAAHIVNFVVLTAALSSMNCNLYLCTRMMFSLARGGYAPALLGRLSRRNTPVNALMASASGLFLAVLTALFFPSTAYVYLFGVALFGGLFVWMMIFATHLRFRPRMQRSGRRLAVRMPFFPYTSIAGMLFVVAIIVSTWWVPDLRVTLYAGIPWLAVISAAYWLWGRRAGSKRAAWENKSATGAGEY